MKKIEELQKQIAELQEKLQNQETKNAYLEGLLSASGSRGDREDSGVIKESPARSKLWASISHELLTPMDAILGMTELVMDTELSEEQRNYLEMINASADRLFSVVGDIIDYSQLVEGKLRCDTKNFELFEELEYDLYIARLSAKHKDLKFTATFAKDIPGYLNTDPGRLRQVLNTLINNAINFTSEGEVTVAIDKGGYDDDGQLLLSFTIRDTGPGIPDDVQYTIFETPMSIELSGNEEKYSEGGLGLVVAAKLVELFGGEIGVSSKKQGGATFWFTWPVANPVEMHMGDLPSDMLSEVRDRSMVLQGAKVLLAEDEPINASITKAFLEQAGVLVDVVSDGNEAVRAVSANDYQAILMDVQMPVMDGIEATVKIRRNERSKGNRSPIIALTAHAMRGDRERCLQAGMDGYLAKPLDKNQLVEMLARFMTKKALVVGSDPANQHEIIEPLVRSGWAFVIAETGRSAMYEASLSHFDIIIIDASLPVEDGVETVQTIRKLEKYSGYRAMILGTGFTEEEEYQQYTDCGIDEFYLRPTMAKDVARVVEELDHR
ncbi:MAG: response regulator [Desulfocapsaceae bacterium]|nr:response regulator [Desulfocapsaceae bacterium]